SVITLSPCDIRDLPSFPTRRSSDLTELPSGIRSRHIFSRELRRRLLDSGIEEDLAQSLIFHLANGIFRAAGEKDAIDKQTLSMRDRKSTRLNSSHVKISYAVFCLKK